MEHPIICVVPVNNINATLKAIPQGVVHGEPKTSRQILHVNSSLNCGRRSSLCVQNSRVDNAGSQESTMQRMQYGQVERLYYAQNQKAGFMIRKKHSIQKQWLPSLPCLGEAVRPDHKTDEQTSDA